MSLRQYASCVLLAALFGLYPDTMQTDHQFPSPLTGVSVAQPDAIQLASAAETPLERKRRLNKEAVHRYNNRHHQRVLDRWARYRSRFPEKVKAANTRWKTSNPERSKEAQRKYRLANKEKIRSFYAAYIKANPESKYRARSRRNHRIIQPDAEERRRIVRFVRSVRSKRVVVCHYCNRKMSGKACQIDHVIALASGGQHEVGNLCVSCPDCNARKRCKLPTELYWESQMRLL